MRQAQGLHDVLLDPIIQPNASTTLQNATGPIDSRAVFPNGSGLVNKRHLQDVSLVRMEDVISNWSAIVSQLRVKALKLSVYFREDEKQLARTHHNQIHSYAQ